MKKLLLIAILLTVLAQASISRLYIGETGGQAMAGLDTRIDIGPFFIGSDIKTVIRQFIANDYNKVIAFLPDRTDYQLSAGIALERFELRYAHTCYYRVISSSDLSLYENNVNPDETKTLSIKFFF